MALIDLSDRTERERLSSDAVPAFFNIMVHWKIRDDDARRLLGGMSNGAYYALKKGGDRALDEDKLRRISYLVSIFKALSILYSEELADRWMQLPNKVAWHKSVELAEIDWMEESVTYDDYLADFGGEYHDIRGDATYEKCLDPDSYVESQMLAEALLGERASGIIYPSVRHNDGVCLACFRPALVSNVRKSARYRFTWTGSPEPEIEFEETYI